MKSFKYTITDPFGIHIRSAGILIKEAKKFNSKIILHYNNLTADARIFLELLLLKVKCGAIITVTIEGEDEDVALVTLKEFFNSYL